MSALASLAPLPGGDAGAALTALRDLGRVAMTQGDDALAESCWHVVRRLAPDDPWAGHNQATCLQRRGRLDEAEQQYDDQLSAFPDFVPSWRGRAQVAARKGRPDAALACFERALELAPLHFETLIDCAHQYLALSRPDEAHRRLSAAVSISPGDCRVAQCEAALVGKREDWRQRGETALAEGRADEAQSLLVALTEFDPTYAEACTALARTAAQRGCAEDAVRFFLRAAALKPADPWIRNELGHFAVDQGDLTLAEAQFGIVLRRLPDFFHALRGLARVAKARGDLEGALAAFERAARAEPGDPWMPCEIATLEASLGRAGADERLRDLIARRPDFTPAYQTLSRLVRDPEEALRLLETASALRPGDPWLGFEAAKARRACGDSAGAEARLRDLAQGGAASAAARLELYHMLRERGEDEQAADHLRESLLAAPQEPGLLVAEAGRLAGEGRLDEADALYDELARRDVAPYWRRIGKGALARRRGDSSQARRWFEEALALEPLDPAAYGELCALTTTQAEAQDMQRRLDAWITAAPQLFAARAQKARYAAQCGDYAGALAEWRAVADIWPERPEVYVEMAREQERLGDAAAALGSLARAAALAPRHPALLEAQARQAEWRDDIETARALMARALEIAPARRWLRPQLARLHFMAGRADAAFAWLDKFPADPELEFQRIDMLRQTGRLAEAAAASQAARRRFDGCFRLLWQAVCLDVDLGRFEPAKLALETARPINRRETAGVAFLYGHAAMAQWDFATARTYLEAACRDNPEDGWALNRLIHCRLLTFDMAAARAGLEALASLNQSINRIKGKSTAWSQTHYGQLYDEFRLDPEALRATTDALAMGDEEARLAALRRCVRDFPHYTPGCMAALIACRRAGLLKPRAPRDGARALPLRHAQFWDAADPPADLEPYLRSWREHDPEIVYQRFDDASAQNELARMASHQALQAFRRAEQPAMRADIFRLAHLYAHGGAYADADDRCQTSLAPLRAKGAALVVYQEDLGSIGNNFLMASPKHPVIGKALAEAARAVEEGSADLLWLATGPGALTRALATHVFEDETDWRRRLDDILILDRAELLAHVAIHCHSGYKTTERHWSRSAFKRSARAG